MVKTDKAVDTKKKTVVKTKIAKPKSEKISKKRNLKLPKPIKAIGEYFAGAWSEIRQVRWPNRKATWSLTGAVLIFTAFWSLIVLGLDLLFQSLLNNVILT